ncbi:MAG: hypothetical protein EPN43_00165 [Jatrophihabitans sp.]|nr:MAG: hypothetical protein EPN43_00165 [Jatrophihabitans sp.]
MTSPVDRPGLRPVFELGSARARAWLAGHPNGYLLSLGARAGIHRAGCSLLAGHTGPVVASPDVLALQYAMLRLEGDIVACRRCRPHLDPPAEAFGAR